jgi:hypothetical protein
VTRLKTAVIETGVLSTGLIVESPEHMSETGQVWLDVRRFTEPAEIIIGRVSYRIAVGKGPEEVIFFADTPELLEPYRNYLL